MDPRAPTNASVANPIEFLEKTQSEDPPIVGRSANYVPNAWDYAFVQTLTSDYTEEAYGHVAKKLKEEVRLLFQGTEPLHLLKLIHALQQLGLGFHFKEEIKRVLNIIFTSNYHKEFQLSLHDTAICFMLLRQHGFMVSQDIFNGFKNKNGGFMLSLGEDVKGLLSLYQASNLAYDGESTLEAARTFTSKHLRTHELSTLAGEVAHALELPSHWRVPRLEARRYIDVYNHEEDMNPIVLLLAKLDFNMVQSTHQKELKEMTRWWVDLDLARKVKFPRDRLMECFFSAMGLVSHPEFGYCREGLTKVGTLITIIDDVYDIFGSLDELELFTQVVDRWEIKEMEGIPECMRWADLCKSFLVEAKWHKNGYTPTLKEYLNNGWISISGHVFLFHTYFLLRDKIIKGALQCLKNYPNLIRLSSLIFRLCNDLAAPMGGLERSDGPTSIQCYMHENGVSDAVAREHILSLIRDTWKKMNKECASSSRFPQYFVDVAVNIARMAHCIYQHRDGLSNPYYEIKGHIISLLVKPIALNEEGLLNACR